MKPRYQFNYVHGDDTVCVSVATTSTLELVEAVRRFLNATGHPYVSVNYHPLVTEVATVTDVSATSDTTHQPITTTSDLNPSEDGQEAT